MFDGTGFFVLLVAETIYDIRHFLLLLLTTLLMFGVPILLLDANSDAQKPLIEDSFHFWLLDFLYNQYLLCLGEFGLDNFGDHPQAVLVYLFFVAATFFSQLTILNMLIAIMGESFSRVFESRDVNSTRMKLELLADLSAVLPQQSPEPERATNLLLVKPIHEEDDDEDDEWEGTLRRLTRLIERQGTLVKADLGARCDKLQQTLEETNKKEQLSNRLLKAHIDSSVRT